jgi:mannose-6-phosphate isomerase-like protein (cupin superfamily)
MSHGVPFKIGPPEDRLYPFRVVADGGLSNGLALGDTKIPAGTPGPARHIHTHEDEALYVLSGVLTVEVGDERYDAGSESFVFMPRGLPHAFGNLGEQEVRAVVLFNSTTLSRMFEEQAEYRASVSGAPDPAVLTEISERYGVRPVGGPLLR